MTTLVNALGVLLGLYTVWAAVLGKVYGKSGPVARTISRDATPRHFWAVIAIYAGLSVLLLTLF